MTRGHSVQMFVGLYLSCDLLGFPPANFNSDIFVLTVLIVRDIPCAFGKYQPTPSLCKAMLWNFRRNLASRRLGI